MRDSGKAPFTHARQAARALILAALVLVALTGCLSRIAYIPPVADGYRVPADFRVVGYFPSWSGNAATIQYRALTHICYAFASPTVDGTYAPIEQEAKLVALVGLGHAMNVRVLLSVGGGTAGATRMLDAVTADPVTRARFIDNTMMLVYLYSLDGIDMDWEYPTEANSEAFGELIHDLADRLHAEGKLLSLAVSADGWHGDQVPDSALDEADFLNIMAYDDGYGVQPPVPHSSYWFARAALDYWLGTRLVPPSKANLGVPFYGRSLKDRHSISFAKLRQADERAAASDLSGDFGYNGFDTLRAKAVNLARARAGGIMIWQLNQDATGSDSLLNAIFDAVKEPVEPTLMAAPGPTDMRVSAE